MAYLYKNRYKIMGILVFFFLLTVPVLGYSTGVFSNKTYNPCDDLECVYDESTCKYNDWTTNNEYIKESSCPTPKCPEGECDYRKWAKENNYIPSQSCRAHRYGQEMKSLRDWARDNGLIKKDKCPIKYPYPSYDAMDKEASFRFWDNIEFSLPIIVPLVMGVVFAIQGV